MEFAKMKAENLFKALADKTRLRTVVLLVGRGELCVCELTEALGVSQPKMSRHLATLREAGVVSDRKEGLWVFYGLAPSLPAWAREVLERTTAGVSSEQPFAGDRQGLRLVADDALRCRVA
jgi:ArsR family transcriptional regulator